MVYGHSVIVAVSHTQHEIQDSGIVTMVEHICTHKDVEQQT